MIPIIDTGHGYNTAGKRSIFHNYPNGKVMLKENCVNESVGNKLSMINYLNNKEHYFITNEWYDVSLTERCKREHAIHNKLKAHGKQSYFISIHADAFHIKDKAKGGRFFYNSESGRQLALHFTSYLQGNGYELDLREPMQSNFKVLRSTKSTAVLFELGFMTTKHDLDYLLKDSFRNKTAHLLYNASQDL